MPDYTLENIKELDRGVNKTFAKGLETKASKDHLKIATVVTSKNRIQSYTWLGDINAMSEWNDERQREKLKDYKYDIEKKDWETSFYITRDDFIFDGLGIATTKVDDLLYALDDHYNEITAELINANGICFDGQPFFGEHTIKVKGADVSYNNYSDFALTRSNVFKVIRAMRAIKKTNGRSMRIKPNIIYIAPDLLETALAIFNSNVLGGDTNTAKSLLEIVVGDDMAEGTWCVMDTTRPVKPIILQVTKKPTKVDRLTQSPLEGKEIYYGIDSMDNAGYSFWQLAHFCDGTEAA